MAAGLIAALARSAADLEALGRPFALVGGFAVSARAEPRFTRDVDFAVAVESDAEAERVIADLGYVVRATVEHTAVGRLATTRLLVPSSEGVVVDLLFASSGYEAEIAAAAERLDIVPGVVVPVAIAPHLVAMKVLSERDGREQDRLDVQALLRTMDPDGHQAVRAALSAIEARGFGRGRALQARFDVLLEASRRGRKAGSE